MRKFSFIAMLTICWMFTSSALAQNYYDPGYFKNDNQGYANSGYSGGYNYSQNYGYNQNYDYYRQQAKQQAANIKKSYSQANNQPNIERRQRGVGTIYIGADYVLGYTSFVDEDYNLGSIITGSSDYEFSSRDFDKQTNAVSGNLGWRPFKNIGIEAFYTSSLKSSTKENLLSATGSNEFATVDKETSYRGYGIDIIGYYQVNDFIELLASIGVGKYDYEADITIKARDVGVVPGVIRDRTQTFEDSVTAYRIGGGFQAWLSQHLAFRLTGKVTRIGGEFADYITEVNMGVRYHF